jgi:hypothetical protein
LVWVFLNINHEKIIKPVPEAIPETNKILKSDINESIL